MTSNDLDQSPQSEEAAQLEQTAQSEQAAMFHLMEMADLLRPMAVRVAATLRLADHIEAGRRSAAELAAATGASEPHVRMLLTYLADLGVLADDGAGGYANTDLSRPLRSDAEMSLRQSLDVNGVIGRSQLGLVGLLHTVMTGRTSHESVFGRGYWEDLNSSPEVLESMRDMGHQEVTWGAEEVVHGYDWSQVGSVIDVGGNSGTLLIELLRTHTHLQGTVLDLANSAALAEEAIREAGLDDRARAVTGDFFGPLPTGHDVYLLSAIFNDWDDEDSVRLLRNVAEAAGPQGRVVLGEVSMRYELLTPRVSEMELSMSTLCPAPVRSVDDVAALAEKAGLTVTYVREEHPLRTVIELRPTTGDGSAR